MPSACAMSPLPLSESTKVESKVSRAAASEGDGPEATAAEEYRISCKYEMGNCERRARKVCRGRYEVVNRANSVCANCGLSPDTFGKSNDSAGTPVYQGSLHVRCR